MTDADKTRIEEANRAYRRRQAVELLSDADEEYKINCIATLLESEQGDSVWNKAIQEIKKHIGYRSYDVDGNHATVEVQKLQQYLTSLLKSKPE